VQPVWAAALHQYASAWKQPLKSRHRCIVLKWGNVSQFIEQTASPRKNHLTCLVWVNRKVANNDKQTEWQRSAEASHRPKPKQGCELVNVCKNCIAPVFLPARKHRLFDLAETYLALPLTYFAALALEIKYFFGIHLVIWKPGSGLYHITA